MPESCFQLLDANEHAALHNILVKFNEYSLAKLNYIFYVHVYIKSYIEVESNKIQCAFDVMLRIQSSMLEALKRSL